jgi:hypothetical protein
MAMRMKYTDKIDDTANHWNIPPGESSPNLNRMKYQDFQEYMGECEDMNEKSESDVEASHTQKSGEEEEEEEEEEKEEEEADEEDKEDKETMMFDSLGEEAIILDLETSSHLPL